MNAKNHYLKYGMSKLTVGSLGVGLAQEVEQLSCNRKVASSITSPSFLSVDVSLGKTQLTLTALDELAVALHG